MRLKLLWAFMLLTAVLYWPAMHAPFVFDDSLMILQNPIVTMHAPVSLHSPRSVLLTTFRLNYLFAGTDPFSYHVANLALHLLNGFLVFRLLTFLLLSNPVANQMAAGLFLLHPLQSESVIYISARSELLALTFGLLAFIAFEKRYWILSGIAIVLAVMTKESALMIPAIIGLRELLRHRKSWPYLVPGFSIAALAVASFPKWYLEEAGRSWTEHLLLQSAQFVRYLGMIVVPIHQTIDHDAEVIPAALGVVALSVLGLFFVAAIAFRTEHPAWSLALGWLLIAAAPRFLFNIPEFMSEHHLYLPMVGVSLLFASLFTKERNDYVPTHFPETALE